jgi:hypothetical protein
MRTEKECLQYLVDYVAVSARFVEEAEDGYIFELYNEMEDNWECLVLVKKDRSIRLDEYEVLHGSVPTLW